MLTREQLAQIVHATINRMPSWDAVGEELLHVQPWAVLDEGQREYCATIGWAVASVVLGDAERERRRGDLFDAATH